MSKPSTAPRQPERRARLVHVREGELVHHDEAAWKVDKVIDLKSVLATDVEGGVTKVLLVKDLQAPPPPTDGAPSQLPKPLDGISEADWAIAEARHEAIKPLLELPHRSRRDVESRAAEIGRNTATLYEWIQRYSAYEDVTALIPHVRGWRKGKRRIPVHADAIIKHVIDDYYLSTKRPTVLKTIEEVHGRCQRAGIKLPSDSTIRARISQVPESTRLRRRGYSEEARAKFQPTPGHFPTADHPLARVQIDHTEADIELVDDEHRRSIGRPWITVAIDVYSRMITGFLLSLDPPSETSVALCVAQALLPKEELLLLRKLDAEWPVWGFPDVIHVDNGGEFRSNNFKKSCEAHGIDLEFRPVKQPNYGGHIERLIGTFMKEVHSLPGSTFSRPSQKGDLDPEKEAALTFSEFDDWMFDYLCNVYHRKVHSKIDTTPLARWEKGVLGTGDQPGAGLPPRPDNPTTILRDFLPRFERTVQRSGVSIDDVGYYADTLRHWINARDPEDRRRKRKLLFRRDPRDISRIWFHDPEANQYFEVPAVDRRFPQANIWELREAKRAIKSEGKNTSDPAQLIEALNRLRAKAEAASAATKKARRKTQRHKEHRRKQAAEAAETRLRTEQQPAATIDPLADLLDEQPASFGRA